MATIVEERSRITAKGQTTVPKAIRQALGVGYGGEIVFVASAEGVTVRKAGMESADPVLQRFLDFLASDMASRPEGLARLEPALRRHLAELTEGVAVDLNAEIDGPVDL